MADTFTALLRLVLQETGGNQNVWGDINNASDISLIEDAIAGREDVDVTLADQTLVGANGADDPARAALLIVSGNPGTTRNVIVPSTSKLYAISNETSPAFDVTLKTALGAGIVITGGQHLTCYVDSALDDIVLLGAAPAATETVAGVAEIATQAEVDAGVDDTRIVTPAKLASSAALPQATEIVRGAAELATQAETDAGTDDLRIVTPLKLEGRAATELLTGLAAIADQTEVDTGTDDTKFITPLKLASTPAGLAAYRGCKVYQTAGFSFLRDDVPNLTFTGPNPGGAGPVNYNAEVFDTDNIHDVSVNNERFTIPAGISKIRIKGGFRFLGDGSAGLGHALIRKNGSTTLTIDPNYTAGWIPVETMSEGAGSNGSHYGWQSFDTGTITVTGSGTEFFVVHVLAQAGNRNVVAGQAWCEVELVE